MPQILRSSSSASACILSPDMVLCRLVSIGSAAANMRRGSRAVAVESASADTRRGLSEEFYGRVAECTRLILV
jgi:hypothetical protein